jgi:YfiH family protein
LHFGTAGHDAKGVLSNVRAAALALNVDPTRLYVVTQVHGRDVARIRGDEDRRDVLGQRADVVLTDAPGVACGVKVADCVPILLADRESGAVAAIHSGWQGTKVNVVAAGVDALRRNLGRQGELVAAIGPHIAVCCFEVGEDVAKALQGCAPDRAVVDDSRGPRPHVDLRQIVRSQLVTSGLREDAIDDVTGCTKCDSARFFSFRRDREASGRLLAAIVGRGENFSRARDG